MDRKKLIPPSPVNERLDRMASRVVADVTAAGKAPAEAEATEPVVPAVTKQNGIPDDSSS